MNIFVLDKDPKKCAKYHVNSHVIKMILEQTQMLCTTYHISDPEKIKSFNGEKFYKCTHRNHPCAKWTRESKENFDWLIKLTEELFSEYTYRYNKIHKSKALFDWIKNNRPNLPSKGLTPFAQAMPEHIRNKDVVTAYRNYYKLEKQHIAQWKNREVPVWMK